MGTQPPDDRRRRVADVQAVAAPGERCPYCSSEHVVAIPLAGDVDDFYCPDCDRSFT